MSRMADKTVLITGAASGLGAAIAVRVAEEGARVLAADIDLAGAEALAAGLPGEAIALRLDVSSEADWQAASDLVAERLGRIDVLVNNAGITIVGSVESLDLADFHKTIDVDLVGVFLGCKFAPALLAQSAGTVINMSSMCGLRAQAELAGYNAAKAGATLLTKSAALHYAAQGYGIRCNSVHPGVIRTPILEKVLAGVADADALYASWVATHPIGRIGRADEVAELVLYLASDAAAFVTGGEFSIDGGASL